MNRTAVKVAGMVLLLFTLVVFRVAYSARAEFHLAQAYETSGDLNQALLHYERTMHWYLPWSVTVEQAADRLQMIGEKAEVEQDPATALQAYQAIRSAIYATRSTYTPFPERLQQVNERIASLQTADPTASWPAPELSPDRRREIALNLLQQNNAPSPFWSIMAVGGFLAWVGCAFGFILRSFDTEGHFCYQPGLRWGFGIFIGYFAWITGLIYA